MINVAKPVMGKEELAEVSKVFDTGWLGMGDRVLKFETALKNMFRRKHAICVNTGTSAIHIALDSIGLKEGDEVIVPSLTFVGSIQPIILCGAKPVFCDVELKDLNMSVRDVKRLITNKTKAIMPVHYGGKPCDMDEILAIAKKNGIRVIEDAAHAFGSKYNDLLVGSFGDMVCFSFDPIKNITCGEGGAVLLDDEKVAETIIKKRILGIDKDTWNRYQHKRSWFYEVYDRGYRYHMSNINAAIGLAQLPKLEAFSKIRREICRFYDMELPKIKGIRILERDYNKIVPFNYTIMVDDKNGLVEFLEKNGVGITINYIPNHMQPLFKTEEIVIPNTELAYDKMLSIPVHAAMTMDDAKTVVNKIAEFLKK